MKAVKIKSMLCALLCLSSCWNGRHPFDATGSFEADEVTVSSEATGRILSFDVTEGRQVTAGERLGAIDSVQLYLSKLQLQQNIASVRSNRPDIRTQIAALKEQIARQQAEHERVRRLLDAGAATQKQSDDILSAIAVLERQLAAQQSALQNSASSIDAQSSALEIQLAQIDDKLSKCVISSPVSGVVLAKYTAAGELSVVGKPLFKVADLRRIFLRAYLTSAQLAGVRLGQEIRVFADFGGDNRREYRGVVSWISEKSEFTPKNILTGNDRENLAYAVKIAVENDGYIKIGMYGEVQMME
ncbi:MAG: HlyD family efflux transporter periplasmic adaptor subunit [Tannerella sp.]|jgi:HlyD family secretion protein|nr:HlyD family efflux transporter periplasmic adaptor subunit [Tannerella sp.]